MTDPDAARELAPGPHDAITDVPGVAVGHTTLVEDRVDDRGRAVAVRSGVTVVVPRDGVWSRPVFAGAHRLNGNGELTGLAWLEETGLLMTPIGLTNTGSVGVVRDALAAAHLRARPDRRDLWSLPVVAETWDGLLNDLRGEHVRREHAEAALAAASTGPVAQGSVGGGTGMVCHGFKGGIGSASVVLGEAAGGYAVGVLVQANHGRRERLVVDGVPVGRLIGPDVVALPSRGPAGAGSIIVVVATDAPLLPDGCRRLAQRAALGVARTGGVGEHFSGDLMVAFSTGNDALSEESATAPGPREVQVRTVRGPHLDPLFDAVVDATERAIRSALLHARDMRGHDGSVVRALPADLLRRALDGAR